MNHELLTRFSALATREKILVIAAILVVVWSLWDNLYYQSRLQLKAKAAQELNSLETQLISRQQDLQQLKNNNIVNPNISNTEKLADLKLRYSSLQTQLLQNKKKFAQPQMIPQVLDDIFKQNKQLSLLKLDTLPTTKLLPDSHEQPIYKHGLSLTFRGNYDNTVSFLRSLEALPWAIVWEALDYQVKQHPSAEVNIKLYTLSFEEKWLDL